MKDEIPPNILAEHLIFNFVFETNIVELCVEKKLKQKLKKVVKISC